MFHSVLRQSFATRSKPARKRNDGRFLGFNMFFSFVLASALFLVGVNADSPFVGGALADNSQINVFHAAMTAAIKKVATTTTTPLGILEGYHDESANLLFNEIFARDESRTNKQDPQSNPRRLSDLKDLVPQFASLIPLVLSSWPSIVESLGGIPYDLEVKDINELLYMIFGAEGPALSDPSQSDITRVFGKLAKSSKLDQFPQKSAKGKKSQKDIIDEVRVPGFLGYFHMILLMADPAMAVLDDAMAGGQLSPEAAYIESGNAIELEEEMLSILYEHVPQNASPTVENMVNLSRVLVQELLEPLFYIIMGSLLDDYDPGTDTSFQPNIILIVNLLDKLLIELPRTIEILLSDYENTLFCMIYDSISYSATSIFRILIRITNELVDGGPEEGDIIEPGDIDFFVDLPNRLLLCGIEQQYLFIFDGEDTVPQFASCMILNILPVVPVLSRMYLASIPQNFNSFSSGTAALGSEYLWGEESAITRIREYNSYLSQQPDFDTITSDEYQARWNDYQEGMQRLVTYVNPLVDKSFASIRATTNSEPIDDDNEACAYFDEIDAMLNGDSKKSGRATQSVEGEECDSGDPASYNAFVSAGVTNSQTCDAITEESLGFLGSNCKIMTQIILDRMECDEDLREHLFDEYCENYVYSDVEVDFHVRTDGCTRQNMCTAEGRAICTIHDLPILREMYMPDGNLPRYMSSRPSDPAIENRVNFESGDGATAEVTNIPTMYTLRHFGSNQISVLDAIVVAVNSHLVDEGMDGDASAPATIPRLLFGVLGLFIDPEQILTDPALSGILFAGLQDPLIYSIIYQYFLDENEPCGPSFPPISRAALRRLFGLEVCDQNSKPSPIADYADIFRHIPLLADTGYEITETLPDTPYHDRHAYNSDHDLLSLTLASYFGRKAKIGNRDYDDIFDYIQQRIMAPSGIGREQWYFPGTVEPKKSPIDNLEVVSLTIEATLFDIRDLAPLEIEQSRGDVLNPLGGGEIELAMDSPYALFLAEAAQYISDYYDKDAEIPPWLGQGSCYMSAGAWTKLVEDTFLFGGPQSITPQGYTFRGTNNPHEFATLANDARTNWSTLGEPRTSGGCNGYRWGAYSGGAMTIEVCPTGCGNNVDVSTIFQSNQLDIFGLSFKSVYVLILVTVLDFIFLNAPDPDGLYASDPVDLWSADPDENLKISTFVLASLGEFLFGSDLPPLNSDVVDSCVNSAGIFPSTFTCNEICDRCDNDVPSVCNTPFLLDTTSGPVSIGLFSSALDFLDIDDDRSIHCDITSNWDAACGAADSYCT